jgi:outer membrane protein assembly factor BamB
MRRALGMLVMLGCAGSFALLQATAGDGPPPIVEGAKRAVAQQAPVAVKAIAQADDPNKKPAMTDAVSFPTDRKARRSIEKAEDLIQEGAWGEAASVLQKLLDTPEDIFIEVKRNQGTHWASLRQEANRLIGAMPPQGRKFYEWQFGARAKARLAEAKANSDPEMLAEVAQRYRHTEAGAEATNLLATHLLDRGKFVNAALCFERLLNNPEQADKLSALTLFKAALAFRLVGERAKEDQAWKRLTQAARKGIKIGDQEVALDQLRKELEQHLYSDGTLSVFDWALYKGNQTRSAQGKGSAPFLETKWSYPTFESGGTDPKEAEAARQVEQWVDTALKNQEGRGPILPAFFPIAVTVQRDSGPVPLLIFRTYGGIEARNLSKDGKLQWASPLDSSLTRIAGDPEKTLQLNQWLSLYLQNSPHLLYENSAVGTLSTDNKRVYAVDDLALPPHPNSNQMQQMMWGQPATFGKLHDEVHRSKLLAFDLLTEGKLVWEVGGKSDKSELGDSYFLGPPLPVGDKLYLLTDKNSELRLVCLDASRGDKPVISWIQTLVNVRDKMLLDVGRRVQAAHLSYGDGILVCPTNAGIVLGVDILSHSLVWAHSYREDNPNAQEPRHMLLGRAGLVNGQPFGATLNTDWKTSAPIIQDGRVVFTAPDAASVHCVNLRNGDLIWKEPRADDLYLAGVINGKVLLVGKSTCRALGLADGKEIWKKETGLPSGQGVASDNFYYLPLKAGAKSKEPEVCTIDVDKGLVLPPNKSRKKEVPGNLLFYEGDVLSQTATHVTAYRQLRIKEEETDFALKKNPLDPVGLTERGELRLARGNLDGAVADLRTALANKPPADVLPKTRAKLFETLTELFQNNFNASEHHLDEFKEMCKVDVPAGASDEERKKLADEQQRRQANFLSLLAKGREEQGRLGDAFDAYMEFGALSGERDLVSILGQPTIKVRPDVWAQGRIAAMVAAATPEQRQPLEDKITRKWQAVTSGQNIDELRRFVAVFGYLFTVGREARLQLAERLVDDNAFLEPELQLLQLRRSEDKRLAARAVEALARLAIRKGLLEDAAYWYRVLGQEFAQTVVRADKLGIDFLNDLTTDKRLLPYLDEPRQAWATGKMKAKEVFGGQGMQQTFSFEPEGELLPFFQRHRLVLQNGYQIKLLDRSTNEERWSVDLNKNNPGFNNDVSYLFRGYPNARFPYQLKGHLVVFNLGQTVYGFDPIERKKLWEKNLSGSTVGQNNQITQDKDGTLQLLSPDGYVQKLGQTGPVTASYVCLNTRDGLEAIDPLKGTVLWKKTDVPRGTQIFGDDQHVYLVEVRQSGVGASRALRAHDGVTVEVPDFASLYQRRLRIIGRNLLLSENDAKGDMVLRLYDVHTGKDIWKQTFKSNTIVLRSEAPELFGVVEPANDGKVSVFNLHTFQEVLSARIDPKDLDKIQDVHLLQDNERFYLACHRSPDAVANPWGGPYPNVMNGMRCVHVNGKVYAFYRDTGKLHWKHEALGQMLVLEQFRDSPVLIFTASQRRPMNMGGNVRGGIMQVAVFRSIDKRTGKLVWDKEYQNQSSQFYALNMNLQAGTVELVGYNLKILHYLDTGSKSDVGSSPMSSNVPPPPKVGPVAVPPGLRIEIKK